MASKTEKTKKPTGLSITRSGNKFTLSWKIGDKDYGDGQYFQKIINDTGKDHWTPKKNTSIGKKQTSKSIVIDKTDFYPYTKKKGGYKPYLYDIGMRVKGNRKSYTTGSGSKKKTHKPGSSDWASKKFDVKPPRKPSLSVALNSELTNVCTFTWDTTYYDNDQLILTDVEWQTILVKNSKETDGSKLSWKNATKGSAAASSSKEITEDTAILYKNGNSYTRWFRVRARGPAGASAWVYKKHVYALSHQASDVKTSAKETATGGFQCIVNWSVGQSGGQNPIDKTAVQYTIVTPDEGLACPSGASWTDANISRDTGDGDSAVFSIDDQLSKDQCLFIRVNTQHDSNITYGKPQLSKVGFLKDPTGLSVQTDNTTHRATITANNTSDVEDSVLVVQYIPAEGDPINVGVIPHGSTSVTAQCPNWDGQAAVAFAVYAMVGNYTKQSRSDNVDAYTIVARMRSENTISQGGAVPVAPETVTVNRVENKPDTIQVTWDWPWSEAGSAEVSWSDHDDAWESTDEPESYTISNLHASKWNISGLETGKTWYVRVRLIAGDINNQETVTYGPWSDIEKGVIDLSSAPNKPVLMLSNAIIPEDGNTTASWVYTTTDNTPQEYAEIAVVENGEYLAPPIAHTLTAQHITINAISAGFTTGAVYNLACRVRSASGRISEWSDPVAVTIAEPLVCEIADTSLVQEHIETNPQEFEPAGMVSFETEIEEDVTKLQVNLEPIQDLHGYDHPWVGGGGKNLFSVEMEHTASTYSYTYVIKGLTPNAQYTLSTDIPQTAPASLYFNGGSTESDGTYINHPKTRTANENGELTIYVRHNPATEGGMNAYQAYLDGTNWVQLELGTTATSYEPYENICPISGWSSVNVNVSGKNIYNGEGVTIIGRPVERGTTLYTQAFGGTFMSATLYAKTLTADWVAIDTFSQYKHTLTINRDDILEIKISNSAYSDLNDAGSHLMVSFTDFDTYESYTGTTTPVNLGQTVYGGTLDVVSGVLTVDRLVSTYNGSEAWTLYSSSDTTNVFRLLNAITAQTDQSLELSSHFKFNSRANQADVSRANTFVMGASKSLFIQTEKTLATDADAFKPWLASNPVTVVYGLQYPQTYQLTPTQINTLLGENNVWADAGQVEVRIAESSRDIWALKEMPLSVTATGAGIGGLTTVAIERAESYHLERPDENDFNGHDRETTALRSQVGESEISFDVDDLIKSLDDGAKYRLVVTIQDGLGQTATVSREFEVHWSHQAAVPSATVVMDEEELIATITPTASDDVLYHYELTTDSGITAGKTYYTRSGAGTEQSPYVYTAVQSPSAASLSTYYEKLSYGDVADIYRLSIDKPELIVQGGVFGQAYVDPYPALGEMGGYRIVLRTKNGDYITEDNEFAMVDSPELGVNPIENEEQLNIIDFEGRQIRFYWDTDYSNTWAKDFQETQYMGGSIQGDWNKAVSRSGTLSSQAITVLDQEMLQAVRRLAEHPGVTHVRTADGSSYAADVQVSEDRVHDDQEMVVNYSLSITRVDSQGLDGMTLEQYTAENSEEE